MADDQQETPEVEGASGQGKRRARRLLELEFGKSYDFDDPKHEWRRLFSELFGTFLLVLVGAGGAVVNAQSDGAISRAAAVTAPGLMVMILFLGAVSGAHLNPAVSIAFAARGDFPCGACPATSSSSCWARPSPACSCGPSSASSPCSAPPSPARASAPPRRCSWSSSSRSVSSAPSWVRRRARRTSASSAPWASAATSSSPASGRAPSAAPP